MSTTPSVEALRSEVERLRQQLQQAQAAMGWLNTRYNTVCQIFRLLATDLSVQEAFDETADIIMKATECEAASILLTTSDRQEIYFVAAKGPVGEEVKQFRLRWGEGIVGWCIAENQEVAISDVDRDPRFKREISEAVGFEVHSLLCVPIRVRGQAVGAIEVLNKPNQAPFIADDVELVQAAAHATGVLLEVYRRLGEDIEGGEP